MLQLCRRKTILDQLSFSRFIRDISTTMRDINITGLRPIFRHSGLNIKDPTSVSTVTASLCPERWRTEAKGEVRVRNELRRLGWGDAELLRPQVDVG